MLDLAVAEAEGTGNWADAYSKAKAFVGQLTMEEKVSNLLFHEQCRQTAEGISK